MKKIFFQNFFNQWKKKDLKRNNRENMPVRNPENYHKNNFFEKFLDVESNIKV